MTEEPKIVNAPVTKEDIQKSDDVVREIKLIIRVHKNGMIEVNAQGVTSPFEIIGTAELIKTIVQSNFTPRK